MMNRLKNYRIELHCQAEEWWRCNVLITARGRDLRGEWSGFFSVEDRTGSPGVESARPANYSTDRCSVLVCENCTEVELYLNVVPHHLPPLSEIEASKPLEAELWIFEGDERCYAESLSINPWGGISRHLFWPKQG